MLAPNKCVTTLVLKLSESNEGSTGQEFASEFTYTYKFNASPGHARIIACDVFGFIQPEPADPGHVPAEKWYEVDVTLPSRKHVTMSGFSSFSNDTTAIIKKDADGNVCTTVPVIRDVNMQSAGQFRVKIRDAFSALGETYSSGGLLYSQLKQFGITLTLEYDDPFCSRVSTSAPNRTPSSGLLGPC